MKISKLFHWLYAFVMFLPILAILSTCLYAIFNKNAYQSYEKKYIESATTITATNQLVEDNEYNLDINFTTEGGNVGSYRYYYSNINVNWVDYGAQDRNYYSFKIYRLNNNDRYYFWLYYNNSEFQQISINNANIPYITFTYTNIDTSNSQVGFGGTLSTYIYKQTTLSSVFYDAVDKVTENTLFSWAYNSFLAQPLVYIVTLFSIPANHVVVQLLSYWLAISIIWLVFDLIMYVPLLVHRWLDKGVLE